MKTYLVTGGAGFIGSNYIHYLFKTEGNAIQVVNLDALTYCGRKENLQEINENPRYHFVHGNICNKELLQQLFTQYDFDYVVHFAAESHVDRSIKDSMTFAETNVIGTLNLLNVAKDFWTQSGKMDLSKRFFYVSTDEVYGTLPADGFFTENSPLKPRNPYSVSKASADLMAHAFYETYGLPVVTTRCSNNYGPRQYEEKLIPLMLMKMLAKKTVPIYGTGTAIRDWLYVEDHCRAIQTVLTKGAIGEVYNVGGHNEKTTLEIYQLISDLLKKEYNIEHTCYEFVTDRPGHDYRYAIDPSKITQQLDFHPHYSLEDGLRETVAWYMCQFKSFK